jgi:hypothetical protein
MSTKSINGKVITYIVLALIGLALAAILFIKAASGEINEVFLLLALPLAAICLGTVLGAVTGLIIGSTENSILGGIKGSVLGVAAIVIYAVLAAKSSSGSDDTMGFILFAAGTALGSVVMAGISARQDAKQEKARLRKEEKQKRQADIEARRNAEFEKAMQNSSDGQGSV